MIDGKRLLFSLTIVSYALTLVSGIVSLFISNLFILLSSFFFLLVSSLIACWNDIKYYFIPFFFSFTIFVFLVSRPTIDYFSDVALDT
ncbi:O-antigen polysaccharide polymerase Wzy, partial [Streptococcus pneumoniae]